MKKRIVSLVLTFSILLSVIPLNVLTALAQDPIPVSYTHLLHVCPCLSRPYRS